MPGANCSLYGCGTSRKHKDIGIFKLPLPKDDFHRKWREDLINIILQHRVLDDNLKRQISEDRIHICQRHFTDDQLYVYPSRKLLKEGAIPTLKLEPEMTNSLQKTQRLASQRHQTTGRNEQIAINSKDSNSVKSHNSVTSSGRKFKTRCLERLSPTYPYFSRGNGAKSAFSPYQSPPPLLLTTSSHVDVKINKTSPRPNTESNLNGYENYGPIVSSPKCESLERGFVTVGAEKQEDELVDGKVQAKVRSNPLSWKQIDDGLKSSSPRYRHLRVCSAPECENNWSVVASTDLNYPPRGANGIPVHTSTPGHRGSRIIISRPVHRLSSPPETSTSTLNRADSSHQFRSYQVDTNSVRQPNNSNILSHTNSDLHKSEPGVAIPSYCNVMCKSPKTTNISTAAVSRFHYSSDTVTASTWNLRRTDQIDVAVIKNSIFNENLLNKSPLSKGRLDYSDIHDRTKPVQSDSAINIEPSRFSRDCTYSRDCKYKCDQDMCRQDMLIDVVSDEGDDGQDTLIDVVSDAMETEHRDAKITRAFTSSNTAYTSVTSVHSKAHRRCQRSASDSSYGLILNEDLVNCNNRPTAEYYENVQQQHQQQPYRQKHNNGRHVLYQHGYYRGCPYATSSQSREDKDDGDLILPR